MVKETISISIPSVFQLNSYYSNQLVDSGGVVKCAQCHQWSQAGAGAATRQILPRSPSLTCALWLMTTSEHWWSVCIRWWRLISPAFDHIQSTPCYLVITSQQWQQQAAALYTCNSWELNKYFRFETISVDIKHMWNKNIKYLMSPKHAQCHYKHSLDTTPHLHDNAHHNSSQLWVSTLFSVGEVTE